MNDRNQSKTQPKSRRVDDNKASFPVIYDFPADRPIFWGPEQDTKYPDTYVEPNKERWHNKLPMSIPYVVRFFTGNVEPVECNETNLILLGRQPVVWGDLRMGRTSVNDSADPNPADDIPYCCTGMAAFYRYYFPFVPMTNLLAYEGEILDTEDYVATFHIIESHTKLETQGWVSLNFITYQAPIPKIRTYIYVDESDNLVVSPPIASSCLQINMTPNIPGTPWTQPTGAWSIFGTYSSDYNVISCAASLLDFGIEVYHRELQSLAFINGPDKTLFIFKGCNDINIYCVVDGFVSEFPSTWDTLTFRYAASGFLAPAPLTIDDPRV